MSTPLEQVSVDSGCLVERCEKQGCAIGLEYAPKPFHLIDMDCSKSPTKGKGKRCDYLFIGKGGGNVDLYVVPLELKSSGIHAAKVVSQLMGGSKVAEKVTPNARVRFIPVVAHERSHRSEIQQLAKQRVIFRGGKYAVKVIRCGGSLPNALQ